MGYLFLYYGRFLIWSEFAGWRKFRPCDNANCLFDSFSTELIFIQRLKLFRHFEWLCLRYSTLEIKKETSGCLVKRGRTEYASGMPKPTKLKGITWTGLGKSIKVGFTLRPVQARHAEGWLSLSNWNFVFVYLDCQVSSPGYSLECTFWNWFSILLFLSIHLNIVCSIPISFRILWNPSLFVYYYNFFDGRVGIFSEDRLAVWQPCSLMVFVDVKSYTLNPNPFPWCFAALLPD